MLILVLALMMFAGCGSGTNSGSDTGSTDTAAEESVVEEEPVAEEGGKGHFSAADIRAIKDQLSKEYDA